MSKAPAGAHSLMLLSGEAVLLLLVTVRRMWFQLLGTVRAATKHVVRGMIRIAAQGDDMRRTYGRPCPVQKLRMR